MPAPDMRTFNLVAGIFFFKKVEVLSVKQITLQAHEGYL